MASKQLLKVALRGEGILTCPRWNKVNSLDEQCERAYRQLQTHASPISKNSFLQSLRAQNWVLYYSLITRHLKELMPIAYTPTQAEAISQYSHLFRRSEGMYLTFPNQATMEEDFLEQTAGREIDLIVCSDAESILGIGDQGVGGIGIVTAKAVVYTLLAQIDPAKVLSVTLDVGTNNEALLNDPLYLGWSKKRIRGEQYDRFIDKFVQLVRKHKPHSLLHFEDFGVSNAQRLLEKYRDQHTCFNDDVQGTGAVTVAALMSAVGVTKSKLSDQRIVVYGAGTAGMGITRQVRDSIMETDNLLRHEANQRFWLMDRYGLIKRSLGDKVRHGLEEFVRPDEEWEGIGNEHGSVGLLDVVKKVRPTVLIGCSTHAGAFTKEVVTEMAKGCDRPIIFPLSNPSKLAEVDPKDANDWTGGKALLASGSPFPPTKMPDGRDYIIAECNNAIIYPGLGFGAVLSQSRALTDTMIIAGARRLASLSPALKHPDNPLLPDFSEAPGVNFEVAVAVAEQAIDEGSAGVNWRRDEVRAQAKEKQWHPVYGEYVYDPKAHL